MNIPSILPNNFLNHNTQEDIEASQPLIPSDVEASPPLTPTAEESNFLENISQWDSTGRSEFNLYVFTTALATIIFSAHCLEKYHENHNKILTAEILNFVITKFPLAKYISTSSRWLLIGVKMLPGSNNSSEQETAENNSRITRWLKSGFRYLAHELEEEPWHCAVLGLFYIAFGIDLYLHFTEKDHENHLPILVVEGVSLAFRFALTTMDFIKMRERSRIQPTLIPLNNVGPQGYQSLATL